MRFIGSQRLQASAAGGNFVEPVPAPPSSLSFNGIFATGFTASWVDLATNESSFQWQLATDAGFTTIVQSGSLPAQTQTINLTGLTVLTDYWFRVRAANLGGASSYLSGGPVQTQDIPLAPTGLFYSNVILDGFTLNWTDVATNEDNYHVQVAEDPAFASLIYDDDTILPGVEIDVISGLNSGDLYYSRIRAENAIGDSDWVDFGGQTTATIPLAPTFVDYTNVTASKITMNWLDNSDNETGFQVQLSTSPTFTPVVDNQLIAADLETYEFTGLTSDTSYYGRVRAYNAFGNSAYSDGTEITTEGIPVAPATVTYSAISQTGFTVNWSNVTLETGFNIDIATDVGFTNIIQSFSVGSNILSQVVSTLVEQTYYARVQAFNTFGFSSFTSGGPVSTAFPPVAPSGINISAVSATGFVTSWTDNSNNETNFRVQISTDPAFGSTVVNATVAANVTTYATSGTLTPFTDYYARVRAENAVGNSSWDTSTVVRTVFDLDYYSTNLRVNLDALGGANVTRDGGNLVSEWINTGLNSPVNAVQGAAIAQPLYVTTRGGGVQFDGVKAMTLAQNLSGISRNYTLFFVASASGYSAFARWLMYSSNGSTRVGGFTSARRSVLRNTNGGPINITGTNNEMVLNTTYVWSSQVDQVGPNVVATSRINNALQIQGQVNLATIGVESATSFFIGAQNGTGGNGWAGTIHQVILITRAITDDERTATVNFLNARWGL